MSCIYKLPKTSSGPTLPLGQLGHCLRLPSGRGPKILKKKGSWKKKKVSCETSKNLIHPYDKRTKNLEHLCKHWYPKIFLGLNKINYPKISSLTSKERRIEKRDEDKVESLKNWEERSIVNLLNHKKSNK